MKILTRIMLAGVLVTHIALAGEKKNDPDKRDVEESLQKLGETHFPKGMKTYKLGSLKTEESYYHIFVGELKGGYNYRVIVFDNTPKYVGYYELDRRPTDIEPGAIIFRIEGSDDNQIKFTDKNGPQSNPRIEGRAVKFIEAPQPEKKSTLVTGGEENMDEEDSTDENAKTKPAFREWTLTIKGKEYKVRAIYVSQTFGKVKLRAEASGAENEFPISSLSKDDQAYIEQFK